MLLTSGSYSSWLELDCGLRVVMKKPSREPTYFESSLTRRDDDVAIFLRVIENSVSSGTSKEWRLLSHILRILIGASSSFGRFSTSFSDAHSIVSESSADSWARKIWRLVLDVNFREDEAILVVSRFTSVTASRTSSVSSSSIFDDSLNCSRKTDESLLGLNYKKNETASSVTFSGEDCRKIIRGRLIRRD